MNHLLIADSDTRYAAWLHAHLGTVLPDATLETCDLAELERRRNSSDFGQCDLLLLALDFGSGPEDAEADGLDWLRRLRDQYGLPPILVIANGGNELTAVRALRLGACDYLPKSLLTPSRLALAIRVALRTAERRTRSVAPPPAPAPAPAIDESSSGTTGKNRLRRIATRPQRDLIPRYALLDVLGESDRATVYLATSFDLDALVALKVSRLEGDVEEPAIDESGKPAVSGPLFAREYEAISAINDPSIVDIYDYGVHAGHEFLAMEYFPRGDLKARLQRPIVAAEAVMYAIRIARALTVVHAAGLVHRDLKPPNVMLRENDEIVLIDFGLARPLLGDSTNTRTGLLRGSPYYMSPEQAQGLPLDGRSDLYSLGIVLYELLSGRKAFVGTSAIELLQRHVTAPIPALPSEHARFQPIIERLLAKEPADRYASAEALIEALLGALTGQVPTDEEAKDSADLELLQQPLPFDEEAAATTYVDESRRSAIG